MPRSLVLITLTCKNCGKVYDKPMYEHRKALALGCTDTYCSKACSQAHHAVKNSKPCLMCGTPTPRNKRYCSTACREAKPKVSRQRVATCATCGVQFKAVNSKSTYCSTVCANKAHSERMTGKGNGRYKHGASYAKAYDVARAIVLQRDNRQCVACGAAEILTPTVRLGVTNLRSNLHVHHIDHDKTNNTSENLVVMCKTCHAVHHKSTQTPFPWLSAYAEEKSKSTTSKSKD